MSKNHQVLVIEDCEMSAEVITMQLEEKPVDVVVAKTIKEAESVISNPEFKPVIIGVDGNLWNGRNETLPLIMVLLTQYPHAILISISGSEDVRRETARVSPGRILMAEKHQFSGHVTNILSL